MGMRIVIAGESQCNLFAEICLVADHLSQNLPTFCYERIEKPVSEWKPWLFKINQKNKWHHIESPLVWKELLMTGSVPVYIGGASEFLEYVHSYYLFDAFLAPKRFDHLSDYFGQFQKKIKQEDKPETRLNVSDYIRKTSFSICICGAGNPLAMFLISGLLDTFEEMSFNKIYIYDELCSQNLMDFIENECNYVGTNYSGKVVKHVNKIGVALTNTDLLILLSYVPFRSTYSVGEWLYKNKKLMENMAVKINATASRNMYIVIPNVGPACYNATILENSLSKISKNNIVVVTSDVGLDIVPVAAEIAEVPLRNMFCPPVWGFVGINHLADIHTTFHKYDSFHPYDRYAKVRNSTLCIGTITPEMRTMEYLMFFDESLWKTVADRKNVKQMTDRKLAINKTVAVLNLIKIWLFEPNPSYIVNLGIKCDGSFGVNFDGYFSQPAHLVNGEWKPASHFILPKDPQIKISYLEQMAKIIMNLERTDLPQLIEYTPCICRRKQDKKKSADRSKVTGGVKKVVI
ncbi:putative malate dehydrogenase 1B [Maniola jurtina]|uniref:putative malate dehydrogenase 1B n=1 Tax=Maniola jurtina TaxID=191418 RepID=UPI001E68DD75|nr:putative malate dehydrogenase 1B [Maniola jurtina]